MPLFVATIETHKWGTRLYIKQAPDQAQALDLFRRFAKTIPGGVENVTLAEEFFDEGDTWEACLQ